MGGVYAGPVEAGEKVAAPLRAYGPPLVDLFQASPYNQVQRMRWSGARPGFGLLAAK